MLVSCCLWRLLVPYCKLPSVKTGKTLKVLINQRIRQGKYPSREMYRSLPDKYKQEVNYMTFRLYNIILKVKDILLAAATADEDVNVSLTANLLNTRVSFSTESILEIG